MRKSIVVMLLVFLVGTAMADVVFSGDSRVRPRYDIISNYDGNGELTKRTGDLYWFYRARLNFISKIGNGYYYQGQIGHQAKAGWSKMGDGSQLPSASSNGSAQAPTLSFLLLNFGVKKDNYGWALGRVGVKGHSLTDIHYYPKVVLDVPFTVINNGAVTGGNFFYKAGPGKLSGWLSINENNLDSYEEYAPDSSVTEKDGITIGLQYDLKVSGIAISPMFIYDVNNTAYNPMTVGALFKYKISDINLNAAFGYTADADDQYTGYTARLGAKKKLGPGTLNGYFDIAQVDWTNSGGVKTDYMFWWIDYKYLLVKTDMGEVSFKPTWRHFVSEVTDVSGYGRDKIELTIEIKFK